MTLNIVWVRDNEIHVAADFRLTDGNTGQLITDRSPKVLILREANWSALLTYCGVGRWENQDTAEWVKKWLLHPPDEEPAFEEVAAAIEVEGNQWLGNIYRRSGKNFLHSFILAKVGTGAPTIALISNYDSLRSQPRDQPAPELHTDIMTVSRQKLVVSGLHRCVSRQDKRALRAASRNGADAAAVQRLMASIIAFASQSPLAAGEISSSAYSYSLLSPSDGEGHLHGEVEGPFEPISLNNGQDPLEAIRALFGPNVQIVPTAFRAIDTADKAAEPEHCTPVIVQNEPSDEETGPRYEIKELSQLGGGHAKAEAANDAGYVVGQSIAQVGGPLQAVVWDLEGKCREIIPQGSVRWAKDINVHGNVAGTLTIEEGWNRAFYLNDGTIHDLPTLGGIHSNGHALNNIGQVVGSSWTIPGNTPGDKEERAFIWSLQEGMGDLGALRKRWSSRAADINDAGLVVGHSWLNDLGPSPHRAVVWTAERDIYDIGALGENGAVAVAVNNLGEVVGFSTDLKGKNKSFVWACDKGMRALPLPIGSVVTSINDHGDLAYNRPTTQGM